jgi:peptidyl-prolyl cis-trans isomerase SurA
MMPRPEDRKDESVACRIPCRLLQVALIAFAVLMTAIPVAKAQVVALVNGDPITAYDIEQRTKLTQLSTHKVPSRQEVLQELVDEHLKVQLLKRYSIDGIDKDVNNSFANMAGRMHLTAQQFSEVLAKSGITPASLKHKIKADLTWNQVIRAKYQSAFQFGDKDILAKLQEEKVEDATAYDYTLRPILFVVPRGSPDSFRLARLKEAEALRARFTDCQTGIRMARGLRDVAVRAPVTRSSGDLALALREILDKTEIGRLTAPEPTSEGIEVFALCAKKAASAENTLGKRKVREELFTSQFDIYSKRYIKELRSQAMIEYR